MCLYYPIPLLWRGGKRSLTGWCFRTHQIHKLVQAAIPLLRRGVRRSLTGWYSPPVEGGCLDRYARAIASRLYAAAKLDGVVFPIYSKILHAARANNSPPVEGGCLDRYARAIALRLYAAAKPDGVVSRIYSKILHVARANNSPPAEGWQAKLDGVVSRICKILTALHHQIMRTTCWVLAQYYVLTQRILHPKHRVSAKTQPPRAPQFSKP